MGVEMSYFLKARERLRIRTGFGVLIITTVFISSVACQKVVQAPIIWQPSVAQERPVLNQWLSERQMNSGETIDELGLWLTAIHGQTANTAFLIGSYQLGQATYRSVLLRTTDGGGTWQEVHHGISEATLFGMDFVNSKRGFIYGQLTTGDPQPPFFLRSDDGGVSWTRVGQIEAEGAPAIHAFGFTDAEHGRIKLLFHAVGSTPEKPHRNAVHETSDAGETWVQTESKFISDDDVVQLGAMMVNNMLHRHNGVVWRLEEAGGDAWTHGYSIARSLDDGVSWERVSRFARHPFSPKPGELDVD